jgi:hypothetical protein
MRFRLGFALTAILSLALAACPRLPEPSGCTPSATRCENGTPEVCSQTQRWTAVELNAARCGTTPGAVCCATQGRRGRVIHACVPQSACVPEDAQGGALSTPAQLASKTPPDEGASLMCRSAVRAASLLCR